MTDIEMRDTIAREHYLQMIQNDIDRTVPQDLIKEAGGMVNFLKQERVRFAGHCFDIADAFMGERSKRIGHGRSFIGSEKSQ